MRTQRSDSDHRARSTNNKLKHGFNCASASLDNHTNSFIHPRSPTMSLVSVPTSYGNQKQHKDVADAVTKYRDLHDDDKLTSEERNQNYQDVVVNYYDLTTDFYEKGWGEHFHFAKQFRGENYGEALRRQELYLALRSHMKHGMKALDIGCGIGGPMRNIARFTS